MPTLLVPFSEMPVRWQQVPRKAVVGWILRDRLRQSIQGVGPEFHAVYIGAQALNGLAQSLPRRFGC
jgi:hypothetical protein